jgi:hypothetical protein
LSQETQKPHQQRKQAEYKYRPAKTQHGTRQGVYRFIDNFSAKYNNQAQTQDGEYDTYRYSHEQTHTSRSFLGSESK